MSNNKLLLPAGGRTQKKRKSRKKHQPSPKTFDFAPKNSTLTYNQRNEATGLVIIGLSAFILSLTHYIGNSDIPGFFNNAVVYFGMGVYILPILTGLIGIQRFLDKSVENIGYRIAGSAGTTIFGLGLLGLEGGKIGAYTQSLLQSHFGFYPTMVLLFFLLLSSLIFALDILYKDLLAACFICAAYGIKLLIALWELLLIFLSMFIQSIKTTFKLFNSIFKRLKPVIAADNIKRYLPDMSQKEQKIEEPESCTEDDYLTKTPSPTSWQSEEAPQQDTQAEDFQQKSDPTESDELTTIEPEVQERDSNDEELEIIVELENDECALNSQKALTTSSAENLKTPIDNSETEYLDDNPIDIEIKESENGYNQEATNPYAASQLPSIEILKIPPPRDNYESQSDLSKRSALLLKTLNDFSIKASITAIVEGPAVSRFELKPAPGIKVSKITSLTDDIALALSAQSIRVEAPIPGKPALGVEIPNTNPTPVYFYELLKNDKFCKGNSLLNLALGVTISGKAVFADLSEMPHLLIAGSTGSGKSVCVNTIIASILFQARADQVKFVMIDPKMVELSSYNGIPHLIAPVVTDPSKASTALVWAVEEMERRYEILASCGVRKISSYNENLETLKKEFDSDLESMPFIVIIIDELADLMMTASAEVESSICRLAQMARAVGIHLVIATQRPSVNVLTGIIKANLPTRIAFSVTSAVDSRTILDTKGAESLLGKGDMLFIPKGRNKPLRLQGAFISDRELSDITNFVKSQGQPEYMEIAPEKNDDQEQNESSEHDANDADKSLMEKIINYLSTQEKTSTSMLQRKFRIGYNRAARIMDQLEENKMVGPTDGSNKRKVLTGRSGTEV